MKKVCFNGEFVQIDDIQYKDVKEVFHLEMAPLKR